MSLVAPFTQESRGEGLAVINGDGCKGRGIAGKKHSLVYD
jgi:hypothetical protein